jgi:hypothetical protein
MQSWSNRLYTSIIYLYNIGAIISAIVIPNEAFALSIKISSPQNDATVSEQELITADIKPNSCVKNMTYKEIEDFCNEYKGDLQSLFPDLESQDAVDVFEAILFLESEWAQFDQDGSARINLNKNKKGKVVSKDYGISQVNDTNSSLDEDIWDFDKIKNDEAYNIKAGIQILKNKYNEMQKIIKKEPKRWAKLSVRANLDGHPHHEILLKAYNGYISKWDYAKRVETICDSKPWERSVEGRLTIDDIEHLRKELKLIEQMKYLWDTTNEESGLHKITADIGKGRTEANHSIGVYVDNKVNTHTVVGRMSGTTNYLSELDIKFNVDIIRAEFITPQAAPISAATGNTSEAGTISTSVGEIIPAKYSEEISKLKISELNGKLIKGEGIARVSIWEQFDKYGYIQINKTVSIPCSFTCSIVDKAVMEVQNKYLTPAIFAKIGKTDIKISTEEGTMHVPVLGMDDYSFQSGKLNDDLVFLMKIEGRENGQDIKCYYRKIRSRVFTGAENTVADKDPSSGDKVPAFEGEAEYYLPLSITGVIYCSGFYDPQTGIATCAGKDEMTPSIASALTRTTEEYRGTKIVINTEGELEIGKIQSYNPQ